MDIEIEDDEGITTLVRLRSRPELPAPRSEKKQG
jgi:hypothetical protein